MICIEFRTFLLFFIKCAKWGNFVSKVRRERFKMNQSVQESVIREGFFSSGGMLSVISDPKRLLISCIIMIQVKPIS